jgi:hypothetical protein
MERKQVADHNNGVQMCERELWALKQNNLLSQGRITVAVRSEAWIVFTCSNTWWIRILLKEWMSVVCKFILFVLFRV